MTVESQPSPDLTAARELRAVILLAGRVGRNPFADGIARSVLDLPVDRDRTLLDCWIEQLDRFARAYELPGIELRVSVDQAGEVPRPRSLGKSRVALEIVRDAEEYRGTAGIVKDLTRDYAVTDRVLVATANQLHREPLIELFHALSRHDECVSVVPHGGGELAGVFLLRCGRFSDVPDVGFVDMKEQAIPSAQGRATLYVTRRAAGSALPVRRLEEYIRAVRILHEVPSMWPAELEDAFAEPSKQVFAIVEPGAHVAPTAVLQNSVVLAGGHVEAGAVVSRSVVCGGGVVGRGRCVVETVVTD